MMEPTPGNRREGEGVDVKWIYEQATGLMKRLGERVGIGYAGAGVGKNNPEMQHVKNVGPIPRGLWNVVGKPFDHPLRGPFCIRLEPAEGTETFGRDGFLIHGDSKSKPGTASHGCIIQSRGVRELFWMSKDRQLKVV